MEIEPFSTISILMPFKNESAHLEACIESIRNQTYQNWNLLAVDDNSTDGSFELLSRITKKDNRIRCLKNRENGIIPALKLAFEHSRGQYIHRMDADDIMMPKKLELLLDAFKDATVDISTGVVRYFGTSLQEGFLNYARWLNAVDFKNLGKSVFLECSITSPNWLAKRDVLRQYFDDANLCYPEDYFFSFLAYQNKWKVHRVHSLTHLWRDHALRASRTHENYQDQSYFKLKLDFFQRCALDDTRERVVWGAGKKAKSLATKMLERNLDFIWVSENIKKHGKDIYGKIVQSPSDLGDWKKYQLIIAFSNKEEKSDLIKSFHQKKLESGRDYFEFC